MGGANFLFLSVFFHYFRLVVKYCQFYSKYFKFIGYLFSKKYAPAKTNHKFNILLYASNGEKEIVPLLFDLFNQNYPKDKYEITVIICNSKDKTKSVVEEFIKEKCGENEVKISVFEIKNEAIFNCSLAYKEYFKSVNPSSFSAFSFFTLWSTSVSVSYLQKMNDAFDAGEKVVSPATLIKNIFSNFVTFSNATTWNSGTIFSRRGKSLIPFLSSPLRMEGTIVERDVVREAFKSTSCKDFRSEFDVFLGTNGIKIAYYDSTVVYVKSTENFNEEIKGRVTYYANHCEYFQTCFSRDLFRILWKLVTFQGNFLCLYDTLWTHLYFLCFFYYVGNLMWMVEFITDFNPTNLSKFSYSTYLKSKLMYYSSQYLWTLFGEIIIAIYFYRDKIFRTKKTGLLHIIKCALFSPVLMLMNPLVLFQAMVLRQMKKLYGKVVTLSNAFYKKSGEVRK